MADQRNGGIAWTEETWNPIRGCSRVSPGCERCYAEQAAARMAGPGEAYNGLVRLGPNGYRWTGTLAFVNERLGDPLRWNRPRRVFVNSMSDLFHEQLTNEQIAAVFGAMAAAPQHTFQVLTKRAARMQNWFQWVQGLALDPWTECHAEALAQDDAKETIHRKSGSDGGRMWPLPNVWLGVSVEDQQRANERIPFLLDTPAAIRFLSAEPLLGPIDLTRWVFDRPAALMRMMRGPAALNADQADEYIAEALDWIIVGAESGPGARPMELDWARQIKDQCSVARVAFFLKQIIVDGHKVSTPELDGCRYTAMPSSSDRP